MRVLVPYDITDATLASSSVPEDDAPAWDGALAYAAGARVLRNHRVWERLAAGSSPTAPELDPAHWLNTGPSNRWAMFDGSVGTYTRASGGMSVTLALPGPVGDVALLGVTGGSVTVAGRTVAVPGPDAAVVLAGLGASGSLSLTVSGAQVAIGAVCAGTFASVGTAQRGVSVGGTDHSRKDVDAFGRASITRRGFSRRVTVPLDLPAAGLDQAVRIFSALRNRLALWEGVPGYGATVVYGLARDWTLTRQLADQATGTVTLDAIATGDA